MYESWLVHCSLTDWVGWCPFGGGGGIPYHTIASIIEPSSFFTILLLLLSIAFNGGGGGGDCSSLIIMIAMMTIIARATGQAAEILPKRRCPSSSIHHRRRDQCHEIRSKHGGNQLRSSKFALARLLARLSLTRVMFECVGVQRWMGRGWKRKVSETKVRNAFGHAYVVAYNKLPAFRCWLAWFPFVRVCVC